MHILKGPYQCFSSPQMMYILNFYSYAFKSLKHCSMVNKMVSCIVKSMLFVVQAKIFWYGCTVGGFHCCSRGSSLPSRLLCCVFHMIGCLGVLLLQKLWRSHWCCWPEAQNVSGNMDLQNSKACRQGGRKFISIFGYWN